MELNLAFPRLLIGWSAQQFSTSFIWAHTDKGCTLLYSLCWPIPAQCQQTIISLWNPSTPYGRRRGLNKGTIISKKHKKQDQSLPWVKIRVPEPSQRILWEGGMQSQVSHSSYNLPIQVNTLQLSMSWGQQTFITPVQKWNNHFLNQFNIFNEKKKAHKKVLQPSCTYTAAETQPVTQCQWGMEICIH